MRRMKFIIPIACVGICLATTSLFGQAVSLGTWLSEGEPLSSVAGSGDSFTANPVAVTIADNGDNFGERNARRQKVYQQFTPIDFSSEGTEYIVTFDVEFSGDIKNLDTDFRMSLIDTSTNQGFYPISWDTGSRGGTYSRARFVDQLDGGTDPFEPWGGNVNDAINGNSTVAQAGAAPTEMNGATEMGLVDGNTLSFEVVMTRDAGNAFSFTTNASEQNGDVIYAETVGSYDPVNPTSGDMSVRMEAVNSFDGIVFGIFDDDPFATYDGNQGYTVSNLSIIPALTGDFDSDGDVDGDDVDFYVGNLDQPATGELAQLDLDDDGNVTLIDHDLHVTTLAMTSNGVTGALRGDVNLDGSVNVLGDGFALVGNLDQAATSRSQGDLNADGVVNVLGDGFLLVGQLGQTTDPASSAAAAAVPEPGSLALLAMLGTTIVTRRRQNR